MLPEHTATTLRSGGGGVARMWEAPVGWRHVRAAWARVSQIVGARTANQPDDIADPDPFATHVSFLTERWPANE